MATFWTKLYFTPYRATTIVSAYSASEILAKLNEATRRGANFREKLDNAYKLNGFVGESVFQVSLIVGQMNSFLPLIKGRVEPTTLGCIIFIKYELFASSRILLLMWSFVPFLIAISNIFLLQNYAYAVVALAFALLNYGITIANFHKQCRISEKTLEKIMR